MGDKKKGEYKTGFFNKLIGKDPFYTEGMRETADAQFNQRMPAHMKKKLKKQGKKAAIQMADTEYKLQKKYSNPVRKVRTN